MGNVYCGPTNNCSRNVPTTLGQLTDEMIRAFGTEDGERTRIAVLLRMGIAISR